MDNANNCADQSKSSTVISSTTRIYGCENVILICFFLLPFLLSCHFKGNIILLAQHGFQRLKSVSFGWIELKIYRLSHCAKVPCGTVRRWERNFSFLISFLFSLQKQLTRRVNTWFIIVYRLTKQVAMVVDGLMNWRYRISRLTSAVILLSCPYAREHQVCNFINTISQQKRWKFKRGYRMVRNGGKNRKSED